MRNRDYWQRRFIQEKAVQLHSTNQYQAALNQRLNQLLDIYDKDIKYWYSRFSNELNIPMSQTIRMLNGIENKHFAMTLEQFREKAIKGGYKKELDSEYFKSQIARLKQLESQLKEQAQSLFSVERFKLEEELIKQYQHTYLHDTFNIQSFRGIYDINFTTLNVYQLRHVLSQPWSKEVVTKGKPSNFSQRLWGNYMNELPEQLMDSMLRNALTGASFSKMTRDFNVRFDGVRREHINRLVLTELGHVQEQATAAAYKDQDVEEYEYMATFERRTCDICGSLNGQVFKVKDMKPGQNYPVIHPWCRCTTIPHMAKEPAIIKRWAEGGIIDGNITFEEWKAGIVA